MKSMKKEIVVPENKIRATVSLNQTLYDVRGNSYGLKFGTVEDICRQFGIKVTPLANGVLEFSAPKLRLQMLIEKLHFSRNKYWV